MQEILMVSKLSVFKTKAQIASRCLQMIALQASPVNTGTYVLALNYLSEKEVMWK